MTYLFDTNAWLRSIERPEELTNSVSSLLLRPVAAPFGLSAISIYEIGQKARKGKLALSIPIDRWPTILRALLPPVEFFAQPIDFPLTTEREHAIATARRQLGVVTVPDENGASKKIAIYEIEVAPNVDLPRNRVSLRELIARCID